MNDAINQNAGGGRYFLKRLRDGVSSDYVTGFLRLLLATDIEEEAKFEFSFPSLFQEFQPTTLYYTKKDRRKSVDEGENPNFFLYKSDLAYLFSDIVIQFLGTDPSVLITAYKNDASEDVLKKLSVIVDYCRNHDRYLEINHDNDKYLNSLFENDIKAIARFLLGTFDKKEEKEEQPVTEDEKQDETPVFSTAESAVVPGAPSQTDSGEQGGSDSAQSLNQPGTPDTLDSLNKNSVGLDPLELKKKIFSPELRKEIVLFTDQAIATLEEHYKLPQGSLQNSQELRDLMNKRTIGFFITTIGDGKHQNLLSLSGSEQLASEYQWLIQNDFKFKEVIGRRFSQLLTQNADPKAAESILQALDKADSGEDVSQVFQDLMKKPEIQKIVQNIAADPIAKGNTDYLVRESNEFLQRQLKDLGVSADKLSLAQTNILNVLDSWTDQALDMGILAHIDEGRFKLIFGDEIPYRKEFLESLEEVWITRKSILGRQNGTLLLHNEARFATQQALELLDKTKNKVSAADSDKIFVRGIAAPTTQRLTNQKVLHSSSADTIALSRGTNDNRNFQFEERRGAFLKTVWDNMATPEREAVLVFMGHGEAGSKAIQNLASDSKFVPPELGLHDMAAMLEGSVPFYDQASQNNSGSPYVPQHGVFRSPFAGVKSLQNKAKKLNNLSRGVKAAFGKKAANKAADAVANAGLSNAAAAAGTAVHPALGFLAKLATTKKGRQVLVVGGALGLGSLIIPLTTLGGQLGTLVGSILGGIFGGPGGFFAGGIGGGWAGFGAEKWLKGLFSGGAEPNALAGATQLGANTASTLGTNATTASATTAATTTAATSATTFQTVMTTSFATVGTQAIIGTIALVAATTNLFEGSTKGALLADFPVVDPLDTISIGEIPGESKPSEFVTIEKRAFIAGCPENKCENPAFPLEVEYTIVITPKENYTLTILEATDTLKVNHSKTAWEAKGKSIPNIPERIKNLEDFPELSPEMTISPGSSVTIAYSERLDERYNDASISNKFELKISATDLTSLKTGTDNAITGEVVYIGDYSQGEGCWPVSGVVTQLPFNQVNSTHKVWDAFDIVNKEGTPIHSPWAGKVCNATNRTEVYGIHVTLQTADKGTFQFSHLHSTNGVGTGCIDVQAGDVIGFMGTTGMGGVHLDWAKIGRSSAPSALAPMMPDGVGIKVGDPVRSCYDE